MKNIEKCMQINILEIILVPCYPCYPGLQGAIVLATPVPTIAFPGCCDGLDVSVAHLKATPTAW